MRQINILKSSTTIHVDKKGHFLIFSANINDVDYRYTEKNIRKVNRLGAHVPEILDILLHQLKMNREYYGKLIWRYGKYLLTAREVYRKIHARPGKRLYLITIEKELKLLSRPLGKKRSPVKKVKGKYHIRKSFAIRYFGKDFATPLRLRLKKDFNAPTAKEPHG